MSPLLFAILGLTGFCFAVMLVGHFVDSLREPQRVAAREGLIADFQSGALSTPAAFQARCGTALSIHLEEGLQVLAYNRGELIAKMAPHTPVRFYRVRAYGDGDGKFHNVETRMEDEDVLQYLQCK